MYIEIVWRIIYIFWQEFAHIIVKFECMSWKVRTTCTIFNIVLYWKNKIIPEYQTNWKLIVQWTHHDTKPWQSWRWQVYPLATSQSSFTLQALLQPTPKLSSQVQWTKSADTKSTIRNRLKTYCISTPLSPKQEIHGKALKFRFELL